MTRCGIVKLLIGLCLGAGVMCSLQLAWAEDVSGEVPSEVPVESIKVSTPVYHPDFSSFTPQLGTYNYTVGWEGIPAADCSVSVERDSDGNFEIGATASTYTGVSIFYKLRYVAKGVLTAADLLPTKTSMLLQENSKIRNTEIAFHPDGSIDAVRTTKGQNPKTLRFNPENFTLDPFAAAFIARSVDWKVGETRQFDTFNGKNRYLVSLTAIGQEKLEYNDVEYDVWVIEPRVTSLSASTVAKKLRSAKIYMTTDSKHDILKVESSVFIGSVAAELDSFVPSTRAIQVAEHAQGNRKS